METFSIFLVLITIVCFLLIIVVMVQNPKGGGLDSAIGGSQMLGGVQKTSDFLDKSTWTLAALLIGLVLLSSLSFPGAFGNNADTEEKAPMANEAGIPAKPKDLQPRTEKLDPSAKPAETPAAPEKK